LRDAHFIVLPRHPIPLDAVRSEVRGLRATGVPLVGAIGFSAGGHLAGQAALSESSTPDTRIDLAVLGHAITSMEIPYVPVEHSYRFAASLARHDVRHADVWGAGWATT
jgi:acetyl esterase/lipase